MSEIAKAVKLSIPAAGERIKKLSEKGLINKFVAILDHKKAGLDLTAFCVYSKRAFRSLFQIC